MPETPDAIDRFTGHLPEAARLRALRPRLRAHQQRAHDVLFTGPGALPEARTAAHAVAAEHRHAAARDHYADLLGVPPAGGTAARRRADAAVAHARRLTAAPWTASGTDIADLRAAGFSDAEIVTLSQSIGFVNQQLQLAAALRLLATGRPAEGPSATVAGGARFTTDVLTWQPAVRPLAAEELSEEHRRALAGKRADSPYFRTLGHDLGILAERTAIDLAAFTAEGGLPRAERELAATAVSLHNGCVYCVSVHARLAGRLGGDPEAVARLLAHGSRAVIGRRGALVVRLAAGLAPVPLTANGADVAALRDAGLSDLELVDLVHCAAFFAWANRLMLSLGTHRGPTAGEAA
ncbi:peroxidase-related enzyme [Streptomyces sp. MP131-18]|uniref:peroxidase-related enzyme n=1 Tax=Streptomyces sp. MP131-18 TaxID=1857892 RepID=UPI0009C5584E|nr:peroxidase-related enzyme [Streptomyces sp. MP131-18]ONK15939.1 alkylhydroperoxidase domain protein, family [Streptomyces sp. MP131-18]